MKFLLPLIIVLTLLNGLSAQDSIPERLLRYSLNELDSMYQSEINSKDQLPYALAMLKKGEQTLDVTDTVYARLLFNLGLIYLDISEYEAAIFYLQNCEKIQEAKAPKSLIYASILNEIGLSFYYLGDFIQTEKYWIKALESKEKLFGEAHVDCASIQHNLGNLYADYGNYSKAEYFYLKCINVQKKILGAKNNENASVLFDLGYLYFQIGNYKNAELRYFESMSIVKEVRGENSFEYSLILCNLGLLYYECSDFIKALEYYEKSMVIKELIGNKNSEYAILLENYGLLYYSLGTYEKAEAFYLQTKKIRYDLLGEMHPYYATILENLGNLYIETGDFKKAEENLLNSHDIRYESLGSNHPDYVSILNNLGNLYCRMGDTDKGDIFYQKALKLSKEVLNNDHPYLLSCLNNLGNLNHIKQDYDKADSFFLESLKLRKLSLGEKNPSVALTLNNLGNLHSDMGDLDKASKYYQQSLEIYKETLGDLHPDYASVLEHFGILYSNSEDNEKAEQYFKKSISIISSVWGLRHPILISNITNLGKHYQKTRQYILADSLYSICYEQNNQNLLSYFSWLPDKGKAAYWQKEKGFYKNLHQFSAIAFKELPSAVGLGYNSSLISKGLLLEASREIADAVSNSTDPITAKIYDKLKEKRRLHNHLVSTGFNKKDILDRIEIEADSLDKILLTRLGEYAASKRKFQITWKEVQSALAVNEAAIEYARFYNEKDSQYYYMALVLRSGYEFPKLVKLGSEQAISAIPAGKGFTELYKLIWEPMDSLFQGVNTIYYSPDGYLNNISFVALCGKGKENDIASLETKRGDISKTVTKTADCVYLSERYSLHQLSTTRYLAEGLKQTKVDNSVLVFGGVNYDEIPRNADTLAEPTIDDVALAENISRSSANKSRMEYLPGTKTEQQAIQKILQKNKWKIRAFSNKNASENKLKSETAISPSVLHIATHGFAFPEVEEKKKGFGEESIIYRDADNPMARCGLLLAGANYSWTGKPDSMISKTGEDGILTALEVSNLPLRNTKLVVLSACETGLGKIEGTEGVFGLKRGFKLAGVDQIIVSLWSVPDKETMELMTAFYTDLAKTKDAVQSFEKAQKEMRKKYADRPDLWAGFVLVR
jgi:CHAT domain-containing protein/tetratricopeptide (TPR) repeat protein